MNSFALSETSLGRLLNLRLLDKVLAERRLIHFIELFWPFVEPGRPLIHGWPLEAICDHLEAVTRGEIKRLLMNVCPGFMKSLVTNCFWPAFEWGPCNMPSLRYISASYSQPLTVRDNVRFRQIIMSDLYRELWGDRFGPSRDQFNIIKVANDKTGWKLATSVGGIGTGERGDRFIIDDGNSVAEAESEAVTTSTNQWFREVVPTRLNSAEEGVIINIQQRTSETDISGTILSEDMDFCHVCVPMEYDSSRHCVTVIGWQDPRGMVDGDPYGEPLLENERIANDGELAWPERFPRHVVEDLKKTMGPYAVSGQFQQAPTPRGGGIFQREWWQSWPPEDWPDLNPNKPPEYPPFEFVVASLDGAFTEDEQNDPSALTIWGTWRSATLKRTPPRVVIDANADLRLADDERAKVMLMWGWEKHLVIHGAPEERPDGISDKMWNSPRYLAERQKKWGLVEWVEWSCRRYRVDVLLIENKASGRPVAQEMERLYADADFRVELYDPAGDKTARALRVQPIFSNKIVYAPLLYSTELDQWVYPTWCETIIDRMASFPKVRRKDLVDSSVQCLQWMRDQNLILRREEQDRAHESGLRHVGGKRKPLYDI